MKVLKEIEFSMSHAVFILFALLIFIVAVFFFGYHQGRRYERMKAEERIALQKDTLVEKIPEKETKIPDQIMVQEESTQPETKEVVTKDVEIPVEEKEKIPEREEITIVPREKTLLYYIQVGAFRNREYALSTLKRFQQRGYKAIIINPRSNFLFYRVVIGGYEDKDQAVKVRDELEFLDQTKYYLIQYEKK